MSDEPASRWEGAAAAELAERWGAVEVHLFRSVSSTSDVARRLAAAGAPSGTLVLAERQTAGRGRAGRPWQSPAGLGLWLSLVFRPSSLPHPGALPLLVGLGVAGALDGLLGPGGARLKWPNDVVAGGRKLGGILCESAWERNGPAFVIIGVGLNVLHRSADFAEELRTSATSLRIETGGEPERAAVAAAVARGLTEILREPLELSPERLRALEGRDALRGREVVVSDPDTGAARARGMALGVAPDGALLLRSASGVVRKIHSGTVRPADGEAAGADIPS